MRRFLLLLIVVAIQSGCMLIPDIKQQPQYHNPFPQLHRIAVLPFYNQSENPLVNQDQVAEAYINELQQLPGFEVVPLGYVKRAIAASGIQCNKREDFRKLAQYMGVDVVVVGSVTEFDPYYPPRMALAVDWYTANPNFHPIPPGYGLPWGTSEEEYIPQSIVQEAEFTLAREQLRTQTPGMAQQKKKGQSDVSQTAAQEPIPPQLENTEGQIIAPIGGPGNLNLDPRAANAAAGLPPDWPDPRGFIPDGPQATPPPAIPHDGPIITHVRNFNGNDSEFTAALADYFYFRDDARFGGWQAYLQRSDDFIRFCCHQHITSMLASRGGAGKAKVVWRWPIGRYER